VAATTNPLPWRQRAYLQSNMLVLHTGNLLLPPYEDTIQYMWKPGTQVLNQSKPVNPCFRKGSGFSIPCLVQTTATLVLNALSTNTIDQTTACTIATSLIHSKIDYCNSLLFSLPATKTNRLQLVLNSAARGFTKTPKFHHITPILKSLHWLKKHERIKHKVLSHI